MSTPPPTPAPAPAVRVPDGLWVLHVDLDAFFASVEQRQRPSLRGRPVVVGGTSGRGVVATASYEARRFGIGSAMAMEHARRACPSATFLHPRFTAYREHSVAALGWLAEAGCTVEQIAFDEVFVDLRTVPPSWWDDPTGSGAGEEPVSLDAVRRLAGRVRSTIWAHTGLSSAVGVGRTKLAAKLASEQGKPGGVTVLDAAAEAELLPQLNVRALWGVGPATAERLRRIGIDTVAQLRGMDEHDLRSFLGRAHGTLLYGLARGIDPREVVADAERKSVGAEHTLEDDVQSRAQLHAALQAVFDEAHTRLRRTGLAARTVTVKVRYADFSNVTRSTTYGSASEDPQLLLEGVLRAADRGIDVTRGVRLAGVSFSGLSPHAQLPIHFRPTGATLFDLAAGFPDLEDGHDSPPAPRPPSPQDDAPQNDPGPAPGSPPDAVAAADGDALAGAGGPPGGDGARVEAADTRDTVPQVPVTEHTAAPGLDVEHPEHGTGWLVRLLDPDTAVVRFEGPQTPPGIDQRVPVADLRTAMPPPPTPPAPGHPAT